MLPQLKKGLLQVDFEMVAFDLIEFDEVQILVVDLRMLRKL